MNTLINISESILKIEMGTIKIVIEVNNPTPGKMVEILESKTILTNLQKDYNYAANNSINKQSIPNASY